MMPMMEPAPTKAMNKNKIGYKKDTKTKRDDPVYKAKSKQETGEEVGG
jgi:hypothetical protein